MHCQRSLLVDDDLHVTTIYACNQLNHTDNVQIHAGHSHIYSLVFKISGKSCFKLMRLHICTIDNAPESQKYF